jgi:hypothetical protein
MRNEVVGPVEAIGSRWAHEALVNWLSSFQWDHWCGLTFETLRSAEGMDKARQLWLRRLEKRGHGRIEWACSRENGRHTGRPHLHVVTMNTSKIGEAAMEAAWDQFGHALIERYNPALRGVGYMLKSVGSGTADWDLSASLTARQKLSTARQLVIF